MMRLLRFAAIFVGLAVATASAAASAQDASDVVVRMSQLEAQMRTMSGKIEELQYQNQQLRDQLKRFQDSQNSAVCQSAAIGRDDQVQLFLVS